MRSLMALVSSALILSLLAINAVIPNIYGTSVGAPSATPVSRFTVSTNHMTVQLTFPYSVYPGQSITIRAVTTAKSNGRIIRFSIDIFSLVDSQPRQLASQTILTDTTVRSGDSWQTSFVVFIPTYAQRGQLIGTATEVWQVSQQVSIYPNYYSRYYGTPYYYTSYCLYYQNQRYYTQSYPYYNTYPYNTREYIRYGLITPQTSPDTRRYVYASPYTCEPTPYYGGSYITNYARGLSPNYPPQVSSEQTFLLTYVLVC